MAADNLEAPDEALEETGASDKQSDELFDRAMARFDEAVIPQQEQRRLSLAARRFVSIAGAQWEGEWADPYENAIKLEINKVGRGLEKIQRDYNENRIVPDFRPAGGKGDQDSADTLDGMHRADSYCYKADQARDNAFREASSGGFGAYRLTTQWADPYDKDADEQRINPGLLITDADQRVFFDPADTTQDKSQSRYCFVLTPKMRSAAEEEFDDDTVATWPEQKLEANFDWFTPDVVVVAEYYEIEEKSDRLMIFTHTLSGEEQRWWKSEIEPEEVEELKAKGWTVATRAGSRRRVTKTVLSGQEVLRDTVFVAGDCIPVVPVYGKRWYVDGIERFAGHVQDKMDAQKLYNALVSRLAETSAQSPRQLPIFAASQMPAHIQALWQNQVIDRHAYAIVEPLIDPAGGQVISAGPIGMLPAAQVSQADGTLIQLAAADIAEDQQDGADEVKANTSEAAMEFAATRVDARSGIYLDNMRQAVQREGEIYMSMAADVYWEPGREVETMTEDGDDGIATLQEQYTDKRGVSIVRNDFSRGKYKVVVAVTEATATRRDKTVRSMGKIAEVASQIGDQELAKKALLTGIMNMDGEGMGDLQSDARKQLIALGVVQPNEEEQQAMATAQEAAGPDPNLALIEAQVAALQAGAEKDKAQAAVEALKLLIDGHKAETDRLKVVAGKDYPLGQSGAEALNAVAVKAATEAMESPDVLPMDQPQMNGSGGLAPAAPPDVQMPEGMIQ